MKAARVLGLILLVAASEIPSGSGLGARIFRGTKVKRGEMPFMAAIFRQVGLGAELYCGGSIINRKHILTSASCLSDRSSDGAITKISAESIRIQVGCVDLLGCFSNKLRVDEIVTHRKYKPASRGEASINDIAIIRLMDKLTLDGKTIQKINLATDKKLCCDEAHKNLIVAGWGETEHSDMSIDLLKVDVGSIPLNVCKKYKSNVDGKMICASNLGGGPCNNDLGGPLFEIDSSGTRTQVGITSESLDNQVPCGSKRGTAYTKVAHFSDWINEYINQDC